MTPAMTGSQKASPRLKAVERPFERSDSLAHDMRELIKDGFDPDIAVAIVTDALKHESRATILNYVGPVLRDAADRAWSQLNSERLRQLGTVDRQLQEMLSDGGSPEAEQRRALKGKLSLAERCSLRINGKRVPLPKATVEQWEIYQQMEHARAAGHFRNSEAALHILGWLRGHGAPYLAHPKAKGWEKEIDISCFRTK